MIYTVTKMDCLNCLDVKIGDIFVERSMHSHMNFRVVSLKIVDGVLRVFFIQYDTGEPAGEISISALKRREDGTLCFDI